MMEKNVRVENSHGLHARPAAEFVKRASGFSSDIRVRYKEKEANAKSILNILSLGIDQGAEVTLLADGADSQDAVDQLATLLGSGA